MPNPIMKIRLFHHSIGYILVLVGLYCPLIGCSGLIKLTYPKAFNSLSLTSSEAGRRAQIDSDERSGDARNSRASLSDLLVRRCGKAFTSYDPYTIIAPNMSLNITWDMTNYIKFGVSVKVWNQRSPWIVFTLTLPSPTSDNSDNFRFLPTPDTTSMEIKIPTELDCHPYCVLKISTIFPGSSGDDGDSQTYLPSINREVPTYGTFEMSSSCARFILVEDEEAMNCSKRGTYSKDPNGVSKCMCSWLYSGNNCQFEDECFQASDCNNNGECIDILKGFPSDAHMINPRGQCFCKDGWFGQKCRRRSLPQTINPANMAQARLGPGYQLFWKILKRTGEIEIILMADTISWVTIGWSPKIRRGECAYKTDYHITTPLSNTSYSNEDANRCYDMVFGGARGDLSRVFDWYLPATREFNLDFAGPDSNFMFYQVRSPPGRDSLLDASTHEEDGVTFVYFKKKLRAYDMADIEIKNETMRVFWAKGRSPDSSSGSTSFILADDIFMLRDLSSEYMDHGFADINFISGYEEYLAKLAEATLQTSPQTSSPTTTATRELLSATESPYPLPFPDNSDSSSDAARYLPSSNSSELLKGVTETSVEFLDPSHNSQIVIPEGSDANSGEEGCGLTKFGYPPGCEPRRLECEYHVTITRDSSVRNNGRTIVKFSITAYRNVSVDPEIELSADERDRRRQLMANDFHGIMFSLDGERNNADVIMAWTDAHSLPIISDMFTVNQGTTLYMDTTQDIFEASLKTYDIAYPNQGGSVHSPTGSQIRGSGSRKSGHYRKVVLSFSRLSSLPDNNVPNTEHKSENETLSTQSPTASPTLVLLEDMPITDHGGDDCFYFFRPSDRVYDPMRYLRQFGRRKNFTGSERENFYPYFDPINFAPMCLSSCLPGVPNIDDNSGDQDFSHIPDQTEYRHANRFHRPQYRDGRPRPHLPLGLPAVPTLYDFPRRYIQGIDESPIIIRGGEAPHIFYESREESVRRLPNRKIEATQNIDRGPLGSNASSLAGVQYISESNSSGPGFGERFGFNGSDPSHFLPSNHYDSSQVTRLSVDGQFLDPSIEVHSADEFNQDTPQAQYCTFTPDPGPCFQYVAKWFFDQASESCVQFAYGGCRGSLNRFDSKEQCHTVCAPVVARLRHKKAFNRSRPFNYNLSGSRPLTASPLGHGVPLQPSSSPPNQYQDPDDLLSRLFSTVDLTAEELPPISTNEPRPTLRPTIAIDITGSQLRSTSTATSDVVIAAAVEKSSQTSPDSRPFDEISQITTVVPTDSKESELVTRERDLSSQSAAISSETDTLQPVSVSLVSGPTQSKFDGLGQIEVMVDDIDGVDRPNSASIVKLIEGEGSHKDNLDSETNNKIRSAILSAVAAGTLESRNTDTGISSQNSDLGTRSPKTDDQNLDFQAISNSPSVTRDGDRFVAAASQNPLVYVSRSYDREYGTDNLAETILSKDAGQQNSKYRSRTTLFSPVGSTSYDQESTNFDREFKSSEGPDPNPSRYISSGPEPLAEGRYEVNGYSTSGDNRGEAGGGYSNSWRSSSTLEHRSNSDYVERYSNQEPDISTKSSTYIAVSSPPPQFDTSESTDEVIDEIDDIIDLEITFALPNAHWNENLKDRRSWDFRMMEWRIKTQIMDERKLRDFPFFYRISDVSFRKGSILVDMIVETRFPRSPDLSESDAASSMLEMREILPGALKTFISESIVTTTTPAGPSEAVSDPAAFTTPTDLFTYKVNASSLLIKVIKIDMAITTLTTAQPSGTILDRIKEQIVNTQNIPKDDTTSVQSRTKIVITTPTPYGVSYTRPIISHSTEERLPIISNPHHQLTTLERLLGISSDPRSYDPSAFINSQYTANPKISNRENDTSRRTKVAEALDYLSTLKQELTPSKTSPQTSTVTPKTVIASSEPLSPVELLAKYSTEQAPRFVNPLIASFSYTPPSVPYSRDNEGEYVRATNNFDLYQKSPPAQDPKGKISEIPVIVTSIPPTKLYSESQSAFTNILLSTTPSPPAKDPTNSFPQTDGGESTVEKQEDYEQEVQDVQLSDNAKPNQLISSTTLNTIQYEESILSSSSPSASVSTQTSSSTPSKPTPVEYYEEDNLASGLDANAYAIESNLGSTNLTLESSPSDISGEGDEVDASDGEQTYNVRPWLESTEGPDSGDNINLELSISLSTTLYSLVIEGGLVNATTTPQRPQIYKKFAGGPLRTLVENDLIIPSAERGGSNNSDSPLPNFYGTNSSSVILLQNAADPQDLLGESGEAITNSGGEFFIALDAWKIRAIIIASCVSGTVVLVICLIFCRQLYLRRKRKHGRNLKLNYYAAGGTMVTNVGGIIGQQDPKNDSFQSSSFNNLPGSPSASVTYDRSMKHKAPPPPPATLDGPRINRPEAIVTPRQKDAPPDSPAKSTTNTTEAIKEDKTLRKDHSSHITTSNKGGHRISSKSSPSIGSANSVTIESKGDTDKGRIDRKVTDDGDKNLKNMSSIEISDEEKSSLSHDSSKSNKQVSDSSSDLANYYYYSGKHHSIPEKPNLKGKVKKRSTTGTPPSALPRKESDRYSLHNTGSQILNEFVEMSLSRDGLNNNR